MACKAPPDFAFAYPSSLPLPLPLPQQAPASLAFLPQARQITDLRHLNILEIIHRLPRRDSTYYEKLR